MPRCWRCRWTWARRRSGSAWWCCSWSAGCCTAPASAQNRRAEPAGSANRAEGRMTFRLCAGPAALPSIRDRLQTKEFPMSARTPIVLALAGLLGLGAVADVEAARGFDVRDLQKLDRVSSPVLSPDGARVVFARREIGEDLGKASTGLWIRDLRTRDMAPPRRLTPEGWNVNSPSFSADGRLVYFLSAKDGTQQLYAIPAGGGEPQQLTGYPLDIGSYKVSPDGKRIAVSMDVFADCGADLDCTVSRLDEREKSKTSGVVYDQLFVRHWDTWSDGRHSRLFVTTPASGGKAPAPLLVGAGRNEPVGHVPSRPFGGADEYTWSPDGKSLVFSMRVADRQEPWSTNFDLYLYRDGQPLKNLTASNPAWDTGPVFSADGKTLYYRAMKRPGFEADRFGLMAMDLASGKAREIARSWDRSADGIVLSADGKAIYTTAQHLGQHPLFKVDMASGKVEQVVGEGTISSFDIAGDTLAFTRNSLRSGGQLFTTSLANPAQQRA